MNASDACDTTRRSSQPDRMEIEVDNLSYHEISNILKPDFCAGQLFWLPRVPDMFEPGNQTAEKNCERWNKRYVGTEALASVSHKGYKAGNIFGRAHFAHRVLWLLYTGQWPRDIDHINGQKDDNRIVNLRSVTCEENQKNKKMPSTNTSGVMGVSWSKTRLKWHAYIKVNQRLINLGLFDDLHAAVLVRKAAESDLGFHENHGRVG